MTLAVAALAAAVIALVAAARVGDVVTARLGRPRSAGSPDPKSDPVTRRLAVASLVLYAVDVLALVAAVTAAVRAL